MKQNLSQKKFFNSNLFKSIISTGICILAGLLVGLIVMIIIAITSNDMNIFNAFQGITVLMSGPFTNGSHSLSNFGDMIFYAIPLIMTGLSVAITFKTGLFNIGAAGQFLVGTSVSLAIVLMFPADNQFKGLLIWIFAFIMAFIFGMLWGAIPGVFKAIFGANEVIVCIMTNWIAANLVSWIFSCTPNFISKDYGKNSFLLTTATTNNGTPKMGLDKLFVGSYIDGGIFVAILFAIVVYIILEKTTFGYELKACGYNRNASKYAGMNEKKNIILSMAIAGGLAAIGGALYYLNPGIEFKFGSAYNKLPDYGFNGIPAALLASNNPIGVIFSSILLRYINQGGDNLVFVGYNRYIADTIIAIIIYFTGFSKFFYDIFIKNKMKKNAQKEAK